MPHVETESVKIDKEKLGKLRQYSRLFGVSIQFSTDRALAEYLAREIEPKLAASDGYQNEKNGRKKPVRKNSTKIKKVA
jgi:TFIIF-interacting CTD phosphatase-like protein